MRRLPLTGGVYAPKEDFMLQRFPIYAYIPATDVQRARRFYEGVLELKPAEETAGGVVYEFGGGTACFLYPTAYAGTSKASQAFWRVDDIERVVKHLQGRGLVFDKDAMPGADENGIFTGGGAKAAWFKDSEGNTMAIVQDA